MYLIKSLKVLTSIGDTLLNEKSPIIVTDGIPSISSSDNTSTTDSFWGKTTIHCDSKKFKKIDERRALIWYANNYTIEKTGSNYIHLILDSIEPEPDKIDGYMLFIINRHSNITTDGEILFQVYSDTIVAVLREGNYLKIDGKIFTRIIRVVNNKLILEI